MKISEWTKNMKISVSHVNVHQRVNSVEENFNNHADRTTHFVYTSQSLSPATPIIAQWAPEQSDHGREGGYAWAQQHGLPPMMADQATATAKAQYASSRDQH